MSEKIYPLHLEAGYSRSCLGSAVLGPGFAPNVSCEQVDVVLLVKRSVGKSLPSSSRLAGKWMLSGASLGRKHFFKVFFFSSLFFDSSLSH